MRKAFLFLTALLMMVGNGIVKADNIQVSTIQPGCGTPEHGYTMQTYSNPAINGNRFVGVNLSPSESDSDKAYLVFYQGDEGTNSYYIYNYSQSKWLYTTNISNGRDRISMTDNKNNASQFYITSVSNKSGYYQLQPYSGNSAASFYVNYYEGFNANNDNNNRLGFWQQGGSQDSGSAWIFDEVTLPSSSIIITDQSQLKNEKVYTLHTVNFARGKAWYANTNNLTTLTNDFSNGGSVVTLPSQITYSENDQYQQFAFISADNGTTHYLYSKGRAKFVNIDGTYSDKPVNPIVLMKQTDNTFVLKFDNSHFLNMGGSSQPIIDGWGPGGTTSGSSADEGNKLVITEVDDFDPTNALRQFGQDIDNYMSLVSDYLQKSADGAVGYPIFEQAVYNDLLSAWGVIMGKGYDQGNFDYNSTDCDALIAAYNAYINSNQVKMPEDGKAYRIKAKYNNGTYKYIYRTSAGKMQVATSEPTGYDGTFIFRNVMGSTYALVNNYGEYMVYYADGKLGVGNTNDGFASQYENGDFDADITFTSAADKTATNGTKDNWCGGFLMRARNASESASFNLMAGDPNFHSSGANDIYYSGNNRSSIFYLEEVAYPNNVKLTAYGEDDELITDLEGYTIGTFSAPFPTIVSSNPAVKAYYAHQVEGTDYVKLQVIGTSAAIPANQGVILVGQSESATSALMRPATSEQPANLSSNLFLNSAGHKAGMQEGDFVLARGSQGIGFYPVNIDNSNGTEGTTLAMNKAFLRMGTSNVAAFRLVVDEEVTAIDGVTTKKADAPIYDLSGRRVLNTVKGGIYIQNGKKFIVK